MILALALALEPAQAQERTLTRVPVERVTIVSKKPFESVIAKFDAQVGHPNMADFAKASAAAKTYAELKDVVKSAVGPADLMVFLRLDIGGVVRKQSGAVQPKAVRYVVGNPLIMQEMAKRVIDAGSYAPVTILIDERRDGVHLSYDTMTSLLTPYGNAEALAVAHDLDAKVEKLMRDAAGG